MKGSRIAVTALLGWIAGTTCAAAQQGDTRVVILGVSHSAMLVAESYQPAVLRAFIDRVRPDAICIERPPEQFARGSLYEFTYEVQNIAIPYARERKVELCPFDWMPADDDQRLAFGVDLDDPPFVRGPRAYADFSAFPDSADLTRDLFYAGRPAERERNRAWASTPAEKPRFDFPRRLYLYRTFLQAMHLARAAHAHPGGTVLVIVGALHEPDLEGILADERGVRLVSPEQFGAPQPSEVDRETRPEDLAAIATFNLLGAQSRTGNVSWGWLRRVLAGLERDRPGAEVRLLKTRLGVLTGELAPAAAARAYDAIASATDTSLAFTWTGVRDARRLDSFADPFGNLPVAQRARLEEARELLKLGEDAAANEIRSRLEAGLPPLKRAQLREYWDAWVAADAASHRRAPGAAAPP